MVDFYRSTHYVKEVRNAMIVSHENYREVLNRPDMIEYRTKFGIAGIERQNFLKDSVKGIVENVVPKPY